MADDVPTSKPRARRWPLALVRLVLAVLGLIAVFIGLRNAWTSHSTAAPLILGGFLLAAALVIGPELSEISGRYGDAEFKLVRGRFLNTAAAIRTVAGTTADTDTRIQLEGLAADLARQPVLRITDRGTGLTLEGLARRFRRLVRSETPAPVEEPVAYDEVEDGEARSAYFEQARAGYDFNRDITDWGIPVPNYQIFSPLQGDPPTPGRIYAHFRWWGDWRVECHVRTPTGETSAGVFYGSVFMQGNNFNITYPTEFEGAPPIDRAGDYIVTWRRVTHKRTVLAQDTVTVTPEMLHERTVETSKVWVGAPPTEQELQAEAAAEDRRIEIQRMIFPT